MELLGRLIGLSDDTKSLNVIGCEFERDIEALVDTVSDTNDATKAKQKMENSRLAKKYLIAYWVSNGTLDNVAFPVARYGLAAHESSSGTMLRIITQIIESLNQYQFQVTAISCDGASENRAAMQLL